MFVLCLERDSWQISRRNVENAVNQPMNASTAEWLRAWDTWAMMKLWRREVVSSASMAEWLRAWDTLAMMKLWRREVVSLIPDRGTIVGWIFSPTRQILNLFWILSSWGSGNCRPSAPFLYEVLSHVKNCHFSDYYYYIYTSYQTPLGLVGQHK